MATRMVAALAAAAVLALPGASQASTINFGFETGDLTGWVAGPFTGAGSATVVMSNTTTYSPGDWGAPHTFFPNEGSYMLAISSGEADVWQNVSQAVTLGAGESVDGWARFDWGDYWVSGDAFPDGARVQIFDSVGALVATPWYDDGTFYCPGFCSPGTGGAGSESPWTHWSFTAGAADTYTVVYGVRNTADGGGPNQTFGYFDSPQAVPEPATLLLLGIGLGIVGARRRFASRKRL